MKNQKLNSEYISVLKRLSNIVGGDNYLVLGSAATLSFTSKSGYVRQMNDLDIIVNSSKVEKVKKTFLLDGYRQSTFIDRRMPFYEKLNSYSGSYYLRFSKETVNVEILSTKFITDEDYIKFDLYPNMWVKVPKSTLVKSSLGDARFTTLNINLLWSIKKLLNNTLGRFVVYKGNQRSTDLKELGKLVDKIRAIKTLELCRFGYKNISLKAPWFLVGW